MVQPVTPSARPDIHAALQAFLDEWHDGGPTVGVQTSGSTGTSKAVLLSHKNCVANPADAMPLFGQGASDVAIALLPPWLSG